MPRTKVLPLTTLDEICMMCKCVALSKGPFVEIGTRFGGTSSLIATLFPGRTILTINIVKQHADETFADLSNLTFVQANSRQGPGLLKRPLKPIGVLFEDGEHTPGAVEGDLILWSPCVEIGGFVVVHDAVLQEELMFSVGGVQLSHQNSDGIAESGYPEIGKVAKRVLSHEFRIVAVTDSALIFQREV